MLIVISTVIVMVEAHCPSSGVNVYCLLPVDIVFMVDGSQIPRMPFDDVCGRTGGVLPWHSGPIWSNVGVMLFVISTVIVTEEAHCPSSGVNVYCRLPVDEVLMVDGSQVPRMPLLDISGRSGGVLPWHS